ncbi:MAG: hypothetical protein SPH70_06495 [Candidatus Cryptobacteroides sp.]|nr:hypothetical protein [Bacteroidales bacterium]MDY6158709.1 hypothetical protein [Candidatus Cryptobacteroides sp.]
MAHSRVAGPEQERVALRAVADSGKPLPLQPIGSACPSTRSGYAVPCGASRSQTRVSSLPGPANPALCAPGMLKSYLSSSKQGLFVDEPAKTYLLSTKHPLFVDEI